MTTNSPLCDEGRKTCCAGIFKKSIGARNRVGIGLESIVGLIKSFKIASLPRAPYQVARGIGENFAYRIPSCDKILEANLKKKESFPRTLPGGEAKLYHL
jgi:hypothetical protein